MSSIPSVPLHGVPIKAEQSNHYSIIKWYHYKSCIPSVGTKVLISNATGLRFAELYANSRWFTGLQTFSMEEYPYWDKLPRFPLLKKDIK